MTFPKIVDGITIDKCPCEEDGYSRRAYRATYRGHEVSVYCDPFGDDELEEAIDAWGVRRTLEIMRELLAKAT
jgi:hypothetical protein